MAEYIDKSELLEWIQDCEDDHINKDTAPRSWSHAFSELRAVIEEWEPADTIENRHGEWKYDDEHDVFICSVCGGRMPRNSYPFCPWCRSNLRHKKEVRNEA